MKHLIIAISIMLSACAHHPLTEAEAERIELKKCGLNGAVDWDENPDDPPPHCG